MSQRLTPISRAILIRRLRNLGFDGPFTGGRYAYMIRQSRKVVIPNPHRGDIGPAFLRRLLNQAGVSRAEWEQL